MSEGNETTDRKYQRKYDPIDPTIPLEKASIESIAKSIKEITEGPDGFKSLAAIIIEKDIQFKSFEKENAQLITELDIYKDKVLRDPLTKLPNTEGWNTFIENIKSVEQHMRPSSLIVIDLDLLGKTNKVFTHEAGNTSLLIIAEAMKKTLREDDFVAVALGKSNQNGLASRVGEQSDEFRMFLPHTDDQGSLVVIERLRSNIENIMDERQITGDDVNMTFVGISAGSAELNSSDNFEEDVNQALRSADIKMQQDKTFRKGEINKKLGINQ